MTASGEGLRLLIAANYGGRWDIVNASQQLLKHCETQGVRADSLSEKQFAKGLSTFSLPDPDLFIRTGGEKRISNFLLWQLAYTELYFTDVLWPDFNKDELKLAIEDFSSRQRRFGKTGDQVEDDNDA